MEQSTSIPVFIGRIQGILYTILLEGSSRNDVFFFNFFFNPLACFPVTGALQSYSPAILMVSRCVLLKQQDITRMEFQSVRIFQEKLTGYTFMELVKTTFLLVACGRKTPAVLRDLNRNGKSGLL
ncbi:hypothetical protein GDO81_016871 [Engystomops pustulosus]|uniref:Uncharacterized protein n=1 Tax=Engystomops pustulosus TaxID=76066 RepID=A0AAV7AF61_ENGPU|nr:hypothetical protein GDO81_016871 [Engystomops pustulosus]